METLWAFLIGFAVTLFFVGRYLRSINLGRAGGGTVAFPAVPARPCPRCGRPVAVGSGFCVGCGAPMALWNVHRAAVQTAPSEPGGKAKPRPVINATICIGCGSCVDACPEPGALALAGGKSSLANPALCTGQAK